MLFEIAICQLPSLVDISILWSDIVRSIWNREWEFYIWIRSDSPKPPAPRLGFAAPILRMSESQRKILMRNKSGDFPFGQSVRIINIITFCPQMHSLSPPSFISLTQTENPGNYFRKLFSPVRSSFFPPPIRPIHKIDLNFLTAFILKCFECHGGTHRNRFTWTHTVNSPNERGHATVYFCSFCFATKGAREPNEKRKKRIQNWKILELVFRCFVWWMQTNE